MVVLAHSAMMIKPLLSLVTDKWGKMMLQEDNKRPIMEFFTNMDNNLIFILTHSQGHLFPSTEWPQVSVNDG